MPIHQNEYIKNVKWPDSKRAIPIKIYCSFYLAIR